MRASHLAVLRTLTIVAVLSSLAANAAPPAFTGVFDGTGRACSGQLFVRQKTITWLSSFSKCRGIPYTTVEQKSEGNQRGYTFLLKEKQRGCLYQVLYLTHHDNANMDIFWEVLGYTTMQEFEADKQKGFKAESEDELSCPLITH